MANTVATPLTGDLSFLRFVIFRYGQKEVHSSLHEKPSIRLIFTTRAIPSVQNDRWRQLSAIDAANNRSRTFCPLPVPASNDPLMDAPVQ